MDKNHKPAIESQNSKIYFTMEILIKILEMADLGFFGGGSDSSDSEEETVQGDFRFFLDRDSR